MSSSILRSISRCVFEASEDGSGSHVRRQLNDAGCYKKEKVKIITDKHTSRSFLSSFGVAAAAEGSGVCGRLAAASHNKWHGWMRGQMSDIEISSVLKATTTKRQDDIARKANLRPARPPPHEP